MRDLGEAMRLIVALLLIGLAAPAWAEWVRYHVSSKGNSLYYDPSTVTKSGNLRRVWGLQDLKMRQTDGALSRRNLWELNCAGGQYRNLGGTVHSGKMATGNVLSMWNTPSDWYYSPPNSGVERLLTIVCK